MLIEQYLSGDKSAMHGLVKKWHKVFCENAYWILKDREKAKDIAQECWLVIMDKLPSLKNKDRFKSWALRIVYTKAIDAHNRGIKNINELTANKNLIHETSSDSESNKQKKRLLDAIRMLSNDKQDIIRLFYLEEYSIKEISSLLHIPVGTVKSRLFKAREKLKSLLKQYDYEK